MPSAERIAAASSPSSREAAAAAPKTPVVPVGWKPRSYWPCTVAVVPMRAITS